MPLFPVLVNTDSSHDQFLQRRGKQCLILCINPHSSIDHWNYFQTSKGHVTGIILKVNRILTHCGMPYKRIHSRD